MPEQKRRLAKYFALLMLAVVCGITLLPSSADNASGFSRCLYCTPRALADAIANVIVFTLFGASLRVLGLRAWVAMAIGAAVAVVVEVAQVAIPGRDSGVSDLVSSGLGAAIGALVAGPVAAWFQPRPVVAARLVVGASASACVIFVATAYLLTPSFPSIPYWGQWTPDLQSMERYRGEVLQASIGGMAVPSHRVDDSTSLRERLVAGDSIVVEIVAGPRPARPSSIFSVADREGRRLLLLGAVADDLLLRLRLRAADWRLNQGDFRIPGGMRSIEPGRRVQIAVTRQADRYCMRIGSQERCDVGWSLGDGYTLLFSSALLPPLMRHGLQMAWLAALAAPVGYWARRHRSAVVAVIALVSALVLVPAATDLVQMPWHEWCGTAGGLGAGVAGRWFVAHQVGSA